MGFLNKQKFKVGDRVRGKYGGTEYTGVIVDIDLESREFHVNRPAGS